MNLKELQEQFNQSKVLELPKSMRKLYNRLWELGEVWRNEHKEEKEITKGNRKGEVETKIPRPSVAETLLLYLYWIQQANRQ